MFLFDALFNGKTTEPLWFRNIRIIIAIGLTSSISYYIYMQFAHRLSYFQLPNIKISESYVNASMPGE